MSTPYTLRRSGWRRPAITMRASRVAAKHRGANRRTQRRVLWSIFILLNVIWFCLYASGHMRGLSYVILLLALVVETWVVCLR